MESVTDLQPIIMISDILQFCGETLVCIQVLLDGGDVELDFVSIVAQTEDRGDG